MYGKERAPRVSELQGYDGNGAAANLACPCWHKRALINILAPFALYGNWTDVTIVLIWLPPCGPAAALFDRLGNHVRNAVCSAYLDLLPSSCPPLKHETVNHKFARRPMLMQVPDGYLGLAQEQHETTNQSSPDWRSSPERRMASPSSWVNLPDLTSRLGKIHHPGHKLTIHFIYLDKGSRWLRNHINRTFPMQLTIE